MARYKSRSVSSFGGVSAELEKIEISFQEVLSRDGVVPNQMQSNLDMNSNRILNLPDPVSDHEPLTLGRGRNFLNEVTAEVDKARQEADRAKGEADRAAQEAASLSETFDNAIQEAIDIAAGAELVFVKTSSAEFLVTGEDRNKFFTCDNTTDPQITVTVGGTLGYIGGSIIFRQASSTPVVFVPQEGVVVNVAGYLGTHSQNSVVALIAEEEDVWALVGDFKVD